MADVTSTGPFFGVPMDSSGIIPLSRITRLENMFQKMKGRNGIRVETSAVDGLRFFGPDASYVSRFRIVKSGDNEIRISDGSWTRNGFEIGLTLDIGETFFTIPALTAVSSTYDIYIQLASTSWKAELHPDSLDAFASLSPPATDPFNARIFIGEVSTNASGNINEIVQLWLGDIDDLAFVPDADLPGAPLWQTLEQKPSSAGVDHLAGQLYNVDTVGSVDALAYVDGVAKELKYGTTDTSDAAHKSIEIFGGIAQLFGFDAATPADVISDATTQLDGVAAGYHVLGRDFSTGELTYLTMDTMKVANSFLADSALTISGNHPHENHVFTFDDHDGGSGSPDRYIEADSPKTRNNMTGEIGDGLSLLSIDPDARRLYDSGEDIVFDYQLANLYNGGGAIVVELALQLLNTIAGNKAQDWANGLCFDGTANEFETIDYFTQHLIVGDVNERGVVSWHDQNLVENTVNQFDSIRWGDREFVDAANVVSGDYGIRLLSDSTGFASHDWESRLFRDAAGAAIVDYSTLGAGALNDTWAVVGGDLELDTTHALKVNGNQVVSDQLAALVDLVVTGAARDGEARAGINALNDRIRTHGLVAT